MQRNELTPSRHYLWEAGAGQPAATAHRVELLTLDPFRARNRDGKRYPAPAPYITTEGTPIWLPGWILPADPTDEDGRVLVAVIDPDNRRGNPFLVDPADLPGEWDQAYPRHITAARRDG